MTCCIVGVLLTMAFLRIRRLFGRRPAEPMLFAPVARRPAPGETLPELPAASLAANSDRSDGAVLRYCALGIAVCLAGTPLAVLALPGVLDNTGSPLVWLLRSGLYLAVALAALALSRSAALWRAPRGLGTALVVCGAIVFELGVLDMHGFGLFGIEGSNVMALMVFHNIGPALAILGGLLLAYGSRGRTSTSRRSSRSTATRAVPSSAAVTVSATPPLTV